jgi:hypothetical protein
MWGDPPAWGFGPEGGGLTTPYRKSTLRNVTQNLQHRVNIVLNHILIDYIFFSHVNFRSSLIRVYNSICRPHCSTGNEYDVIYEKEDDR